MIRKSALLFGLLSVLAALSPAWGADPNRQKVLFIRKDGPGFSDVFETMKKDLASRYQIVDFVIEKTTAYGEVKSKISLEAPNLLVLMDNRSLNHVIHYNSEMPDAARKVKGVALMALNLKSILKNNKEFSGITYESPAYSLITQFRFLLQDPIANVLAFYRKSVFGEAIQIATHQLATEKITLHAIDIEQNGKSKEDVSRFLTDNMKKYVTDKYKYDAVWVVLDSVILDAEVFRDTWIPAASASKIPFITGDESLVSADARFCTFAISPNLQDMAGQAIQQVDAILKDHVAPSDLGIEDIISVNKILNMRKAGELGLKLKHQNLGDVKLIE